MKQPLGTTTLVSRRAGLRRLTPTLLALLLAPRLLRARPAAADGPVSGRTLDTVTLPGAIILDPSERSAVPVLRAYPAPAGTYALVGDGFRPGAQIGLSVWSATRPFDLLRWTDLPRLSNDGSGVGSFYTARSGLPADTYFAHAIDTEGDDSAETTLVVV